MTDLRKAAEMALDVIIELYNDRGGKCEQNKELFVVADNVIAALETALAQPEQEPVAWMAYSDWGNIFLSTERKGSFPVYTAPPKSEWVGLHLDDMPEMHSGDRSFLHGAKWAEAKLKEKNA